MKKIINLSFAIAMVAILSGCTNTRQSEQTGNGKGIATASLDGIVTTVQYPFSTEIEELLRRSFDPRYGGFKKNPIGEVSIYRHPNGIDAIYSDTDADGSSFEITVTFNKLSELTDGYSLKIHSVKTESKTFRSLNYLDRSESRINSGVYYLISSLQNKGATIRIKQNDFKIIMPAISS